MSLNLKMASLVLDLGGAYALSAARALIDIKGMTPEKVAKKSMKVASDLCIYTNSNITIESISS